MSRAGYTDDCDNYWDHIMWRGQVASATRGKRGQAFLRELLTALDAMEDKKLISDDLIRQGDVCAIGVIGKTRGVSLEELDPHDYNSLAITFGIAHQLVREIEYMNDEVSYKDTPQMRWTRMRAWILSQIKEPIEEARASK